jgi:hypothetical protein
MASEKQPTAVDFLNEGFKKIFGEEIITPEKIMEYSDVLNFSRTMFEKQIKEAHKKGNGSASIFRNDLADKYFEEKFKK